MTDKDVIATLTDKQLEAFKTALGFIWDMDTIDAAAEYERIKDTLNDDQKLVFEYEMARMEKLREEIGAKK